MYLLHLVRIISLYSLQGSDIFLYLAQTFWYCNSCLACVPCSSADIPTHGNFVSSMCSSVPTDLGNWGPSGPDRTTQIFRTNPNGPGPDLPEKECDKMVQKTCQNLTMLNRHVWFVFESLVLSFYQCLLSESVVLAPMPAICPPNDEAISTFVMMTCVMLLNERLRYFFYKKDQNIE